MSPLIRLDSLGAVFSALAPRVGEQLFAGKALAGHRPAHCFG